MEVTELAVNSAPVTSPLTSTEKPRRVVIVDDHEMVAMLFRDLLQSMRGFEVVGRAKDSAEALKLCGELKPDLIMLDLVLPDMPGLKLLAQLRVSCPAARVLICSGNLSGPVIRHALLTGATGLIGKAVPLDELKAAIHSVGEGRTFLCRQSSEAVRLMVRSANPQPVQAVELSQRERTVLQHIAAGFSTKEIAAKLGLSQYTIGNFRSKLGKKTGLRRATQLARYAAEIGLDGESLHPGLSGGRS